MACATGCTDCPACRGEVPMDSPAMHDLRWGMMQADLAQPEWSALHAAQVVSEGAKSRGGPDATAQFVQDTVTRLAPRSAQPWAFLVSDEPGAPPEGGRVLRHTQSMIRRQSGWGFSGQTGKAFAVDAPAVGLGQFVSNVAHPASDPNTPTVEKRIEIVVKSGKTKTYDPTVTVQGFRRLTFPAPTLENPGFPLNPPLVLAPMCCVQDLGFPRSGPEINVEDTNRYSFFYEFGVFGRYGDVYPCNCDCCYFMQFVETSVKTTCSAVAFLGPLVGAASAAMMADTGSAMHEDCTDDGCNSGSWDTIGPKRPGVTRPVGAESCIWSYGDSPGTWTNYFCERDVHQTFLGVVFDRCHDWAIVAWDAFEVRFKVKCEHVRDKVGEWKPLVDKDWRKFYYPGSKPKK